MTGITWQEAREKVRERWPDSYINEDYSGSPSADIAVFRQATKEDWPKNREIPISGFKATVEAAWLDAFTRMTEAPPDGLPSSSDCTCGADCHFDCRDAGCKCPHHQANANASLPSFEADMQRAIDHGNVSARIEALQAQPAAANEKIARLKGAVPCEMPPIPTRPSPSAFGSNGYGEWINISNQQLRTYADGMEAFLQAATEALAAERSLREKEEAKLQTSEATGELLQIVRERLTEARKQAEADNTRLLTNGAGMIAAERQRQINVEGWTPEHDDAHNKCELNEAGRAYARAAEMQIRGSAEPPVHHGIWPWNESWWKPSPEPIRNLVKAGALIAAEIDRLSRAALAAVEGKVVRLQNNLSHCGVCGLGLKDGEHLTDEDAAKCAAEFRASCRAVEGKGGL